MAELNKSKKAAKIFSLFQRAQSAKRHAKRYADKYKDLWQKFMLETEGMGGEEINEAINSQKKLMQKRIDEMSKITQKDLDRLVQEDEVRFEIEI